MKTWEIYKPENRNKRFKRVSKIIPKQNTYWFNKQDILMCRGMHGDVFSIIPKATDEWEIISEPVDFIEAIAALHREGKTIYCYLKGDRSKIIYSTKSLEDEYTGTAITTNEIMNGEWHVEE